MEAQRLGLLKIQGGEVLDDRAIVGFGEGVVEGLRRVAQEIGGIGRLAVVREVGLTVVEREIGGRRRAAVADQVRPRGCEAVEVEDRRGGRVLGHPAHGMGQFVQGHAHEDGRRDALAETHRAVDAPVRPGHQAERLQLRREDVNAALPGERTRGQQVEGAGDRRIHAANQLGRHRCEIVERVGLWSALGVAAGQGVLDLAVHAEVAVAHRDVQGDGIGEGGVDDVGRADQRVAERLGREQRRRIPHEIDDHGSPRLRIPAPGQATQRG